MMTSRSEQKPDIVNCVYDGIEYQINMDEIWLRRYRTNPDGSHSYSASSPMWFNCQIRIIGKNFEEAYRRYYLLFNAVKPTLNCELLKTKQTQGEMLRTMLCEPRGWPNYGKLSNKSTKCNR